MPRLILLFVLLLSAVAAHAERVALVIGNATYQSGPLRNPTNDATDVATKLRGLGFQVIAGNNLDREGMVRKVQEFRAALKPGGLGLFFYSGHGVEVGGTNYLLPVNNGGIRTIEDVEIYGLEAQRLVRQMEASGTQLNVVILDACRDNPLPAMVRSASKGLGRMDAQQGTLIAYATREGQVAADGAGRNSPYTSALLRYLGEPGLEVAQLFNQVGLEVSTATSGVQVPWVSSSPVPRVMLAGVGQVAQPVANLPPGEGEVRIQVSPPNATVRIDGALVGSGSRTLRQAAGKTLTVRAEAEGFEPLEEQVMVLGGQSADVVIRLRETRLTTASGSGTSVVIVSQEQELSYAVGFRFGKDLYERGLRSRRQEIGSALRDGFRNADLKYDRSILAGEMDGLEKHIIELSKQAGGGASTNAADFDSVASNGAVLAYAVGYQFGADLREKNATTEIDLTIAGFEDGQLGRLPYLSEDVINARLSELESRLRAEAEEKFRVLAAANKAASDKFMAENRRKPGIVVLPSGIQYRVIEEGRGRRPTLKNSVTVHYRGSLITGLEFDSSFSRGTPVKFQVDQVLAGWQEILPLMRVGDHWQVFLPADKAYGERGPKPIGPNQALIFEIKLIEIQ